MYRLPGGVAAAGGLQPLLVTGLSGVLALAADRRRVPGRSGSSPRSASVSTSCDQGLTSTCSGCTRGRRRQPVIRRRCRADETIPRRRRTGLPRRAGSPAPAACCSCRSPSPSRWATADAGRVGTSPASATSAFATAAASVVWFTGSTRPTAAPPLLGLAAPVTGALLGWVVLDQSLSPVQLTGFGGDTRCDRPRRCAWWTWSNRPGWRPRLMAFRRFVNQPVANPPKRLHCRSEDAAGCVAQSVGRRARRAASELSIAHVGVIDVLVAFGELTMTTDLPRLRPSPT